MRRGLSVLAALIMLTAGCVSSDDAQTAPSTSTDPGPATQPLPAYDFGALGLVDAVHQPADDIILTTGDQARIKLPAVAPARPGTRTVDVELTVSAPVEVRVTWWEDDGTGPVSRASRPVLVSGSVDPQRIEMDLSDMAASDSPFIVRVGGPPGVVVHRISLLDPPQPNFVFILADDLRADEIELGFRRSLPGETSALESLLIDEGMTFPNFFNTTPLCCPSRASYLTGQYAHNHHVYGNNGQVSDPVGFGGLLTFYNEDRDQTSLGTWLQAAGYETALVGKYLNGYPDRQGLAAQGVDETYVPAGWDEWYASFVNDTPFSYYDFRFNENGTVVEYEDSYLSTVEQRHAVDYIRRRSADGPFFLYVNPYAPHGPIETDPLYDGTHTGAGVAPVSTPSCDELDLSDKPAYIRDESDLVDHGTCWSEQAQRRLDMTMSTDDLIRAVMNELESQGVLDHTYVIFASDNGLLRGEHFIAGKSAPYEESIRVPMTIRGPGIGPGVTTEHLSLNIDVAPTLLELAEAGPTTDSPAIDGESLVPVIIEGLPAAEWRDAVLVELRTPVLALVQPHDVPRYYGLRTADHLYVEYETGDRELYDLTVDPFQLDSIHDTADPALLAYLQQRLAALSTCAGGDCASAARP